MGVDAGRGGKAGVRLGEDYRPLALRQAGADDYDVADAGLPRAREDGLAVGVERRIAQMAVGVDQPRHTAALERTLEPPPPPGAAGGGLSGAAPRGRSTRAARAASPGQRFSMYIRSGAAPPIGETVPVKIANGVTSRNGP